MEMKDKIDLDIFKLFFQTITEADTLISMTDQLTQLIVGALEIKGSTIFVVNPELKELEIIAVSGLSIDYINKGQILVDKSILLSNNNEPVIISDITKTDKLQYPEKAAQEGILSIISLPIMMNGKLVGALRLYHSNVWEISEQDLDYLYILAHNIGISMMYTRLSNVLKSIKEAVNEVDDIWLN